MTDAPGYLVCPACEHCEALEGAGCDEEPACPACGSGRAYRHHEPAFPDAESEAYVKLDAESAEETRGTDGGENSERVGDCGRGADL